MYFRSKLSTVTVPWRMCEWRLLRAILQRNEAAACRLLEEGARPCAALVLQNRLIFPILVACERGMVDFVKAVEPLPGPAIEHALLAASRAYRGSDVVAAIMVDHNAKITAALLSMVADSPRATAVIAPWASANTLAAAISLAISKDHVGGAAVMLDHWQLKRGSPCCYPPIHFVHSVEAWALLARHGMQPIVSLYEICTIAGASAYACCAHLGDIRGMRRELTRPGLTLHDLKEGRRLAMRCVSPITTVALLPLSRHTAWMWPDATKARVQALLLCLLRLGFDAVVRRCVCEAVVRD